MQGEVGGIRREWLAWYDATSKPYPLPQQLIGQLEEQLMQERSEKLRLIEQLRQLGVTINTLEQ